MPRPPLRPTLFPYTTLFRSCRWQQPSHAIEHSQAGPQNRDNDGARASQFDARGGGDGSFNIDGFEDRKSTRLNSSHVAISYAVLCLKKKKKKQRARRTAAQR